MYILKHLKEAFGSFTVAQIQPHFVSQYRDKRLKKVKPATVKGELGLFSRVMVASEKDFGIYLPHGNPLRKIRSPKEPQSRDRRLEKDEVIRLLTELENNPLMRALVIFAIETGMRRGEIASMQWKHINWKAQTLTIPITKTEIPRTIPLSNKAIAILRELPRRLDGLVWGMRPDCITQAF